MVITKQDLLSILITFTVGLVAGAFVYFNGLSFKSSTVPKEDSYANFTIIGEAYGSCQNSVCLSYQLLADGSYRAIVYKMGSGQVIKEGFINNQLRNELIKNLDTKTLEHQSRKALALNCASDEGGVDYKFRITRDRKEFVLDTCKSTVSYNSTAWNSLAKLWNYFETL